VCWETDLTLFGKLSKKVADYIIWLHFFGENNFLRCFLIFGQFWVPRPPWSRGTPKTCLPLKNLIFGKNKYIFYRKKCNRVTNFWSLPIFDWEKVFEKKDSRFFFCFRGWKSAFKLTQNNFQTWYPLKKSIFDHWDRSKSVELHFFDGPKIA